MSSYLTIFFLLFGLSVSAQVVVPDNSPGAASGQPARPEGIAARFDRYRTNAPEEKVFVHTDKSFYLAGEIIWFKLYVVDGSRHRPMDLSKLAYVEILSADQRPVLQGKIALKEGFGNGSFQLPFSIHSGNYIFRAYTHWMKNFSPEFYFEKNITIVNSLKNAAPSPAVPSPSPPGESTASTSTASYDIQFFPEGGNMVGGITSKLAFRAVDRSGRSLVCRGTVINERNDTVARFQTLRFGMGQFLLTPAKGSHYRAILELEDHTTLTRELPAIYDQGYVMSLSATGPDDNSQAEVIVRSNISPAPAFVSLFVHTGQSVKLAERKELIDGKAQFLVNKHTLGDGISHFTVFDQAGSPVCERLYFKAPDKMKLELTPDQAEYGARQKATLALSARDEAGQPALMNMSMAVFLLDSLQSIEPEDIRNYLLLSSDLRGSIESPDYYFTNSGPEVSAALENLLLTQGWSRWRWETVLQAKEPSFDFIPEYAGQLITGVITDKRTGMPAANIPAYLSVPGERFRLSHAVSNQDGQVRFTVAGLYGPHEIVIRAGTSYKDSLYGIDLISPYSDQFSKKPAPAFLLPEKWQDALVSRSIGAQTQNAYQTGKRQRFYSPALPDTTAFYGSPDKRYFLDDYTRFITMEEVMREYVKEVHVRNSKGKFEYSVRSDQSNEFFFDAGPLILFDGVPISDATRIIQFDPLKIKKVEVVTKRYCFGASILDGIVSYTTYQGDLAGLSLDPGEFILEYQGSQLHREFYSPVYETVPQQRSRIPDLRNLLYWSPDLNTDQQGNKQVTFYTSDLPGNYAVVIQGISPGGQAAGVIAHFSVKDRPDARRP